MDCWCAGRKPRQNSACKITGLGEKSLKETCKEFEDLTTTWTRGSRSNTMSERSILRASTPIFLGHQSQRPYFLRGVPEERPKKQNYHVLSMHERKFETGIRLHRMPSSLYAFSHHYHPAYYLNSHHRSYSENGSSLWRLPELDYIHNAPRRFGSILALDSSLPGSIKSQTSSQLTAI